MRAHRSLSYYRRDFDSLDDFDDSLPPKDFDPDEDGDFFDVFGPVFERNSRWSELPNCPLLGEATTGFETVAQFYNFWFNFKSWRDFADADEYDLDDAGFREERRWMERNNEKLRAKKRKAEATRISRLVELAHTHDPRVKAEKARAKESKAAAKAERAAALQRDKDAAAAAKAAKEEAERLAAEEEKAQAAERKREREKAAKMLRKARARLRSLALPAEEGAGNCGPEGAPKAQLGDASQVELLCSRLSSERLDALCATLEQALAVGAGEGAHAVGARIFAAAYAAEQSVAEQEQAAVAAERAAAGAPSAGKGSASGIAKPQWTEDELTLLVKAANKFPGGVPDRWERMAEFINHFASPSHKRTPDDVTLKVKERRRELEARRSATSNPASQPSSAASTAQAAKSSAASSTTASATSKAAAPQVAPSATKVTSGAAPLSSAPPTTSTPPSTASAAGKVAVEWSAEQQRALEVALTKIPSSLPPDERWAKIAEQVPGKTKGECVKRYKEIVAALKAKKAAASSG